MRVLMISDVLSVHAQRWAKYMVNRGHKVTLLSVRYGKLNNVKVIYANPGDISVNKMEKYINQMVFLIRELFLILTGRFDIVHVHFLRADYSALLATLHPRCIISVWGSDVRPVKDGGNPRRLNIRKLALKRARIVTATNIFLEQCAKHIYPDLRRIEIIPFGADITQFGRVPVPDAKKSFIDFCYAKSKIDPTYGPDILVQAFAAVRKRIPNARLIMTGEHVPDYSTEFKDLLVKLGIAAHIEFTGPVPHDQMAKLFNRCDVVVQSSRWESFGVILLEAMAAARAVITTNVGGANELVIDGVTGLIVPKEDIQSLANAMIKLALNADMRIEMGINGRQMVTDLYDFRMHGERMEAIYTEITSSKGN